MICELFGGPHDGLIIDLQNSQEYRIPIAVPPVLIKDMDPTAPVQLSFHYYQNMGNKKRLPFRVVPILEYQGVK